MTGNIRSILSMYESKEQIAQELREIESDIIVERSTVNNGYYNEIGDTNYSIVGSNTGDMDDWDRTIERAVTYSSQYIMVDMIVGHLKTLLLNGNENDYLSASLNYAGLEYNLAIEVSGRTLQDSGDYVIIKVFSISSGKVIELINYNTNITDYNKLYGDEKAYVRLNKNEAVITID